MKARIKIGIVVMALLFVLTTCNLFDQINIRWSTGAVSITPGYINIDYTVWNQGKFDLTGVNLEIGVFATPVTNDWISAWTLPDFSLAQGQTRTGTISIFVGSNTGYLEVAVLGVDMDKPNG